jgi:hypothetical protein
MSAMGHDSKEQLPRRRRSTIASPAKASGHRRPKGLVSSRVSRPSGRSFVSERGAPQTGQVKRQTFRQCFGTAPEAPSRACRSAHVRKTSLSRVRSPVERTVSSRWPRVKCPPPNENTSRPRGVNVEVEIGGVVPSPYRERVDRCQHEIGASRRRGSSLWRAALNGVPARLNATR